MKYGLIAGNGDFPFLVLEGAKKQGESLAVVAIKEETDKRIEETASKFTWVGIGQLGKMISFFKDEGVTRAIMAGQVNMRAIVRAVPDMRMLKQLWICRSATQFTYRGEASELAKTN